MVDFEEAQAMRIQGFKGRLLSVEFLREVFGGDCLERRQNAVRGMVR